MKDVLQVQITGLSHDGRGIARLPAPAESRAPQSASSPARGAGRSGPVVFVSQALPGQTVEVHILKRKAQLWEAVTLRVLQAAPQAVPPLCPHQEQCGGCPLQTLDYAAQLHWKRELALQNLSRMGGLDRAALEALFPVVQHTGQLSGFRNKMEFAFGQTRPAGKQGTDPALQPSLVLGQRARQSAQVVAVPGCCLLPTDTDFQPMQCIAAIQSLAAATGLPAYVAPAGRSRAPRTPQRNGRPCSGQEGGFWRFLTLRCAQAEAHGPRTWQALCLTSPGTAQERAQVRHLGRQLLERFPALTAFIHEERRQADALALGERSVLSLHRGRESAPPPLLELPLGGRSFCLDTASFFQVNTRAAELLAATVQDFFQRTGGAAHTLLDLYCGAGAPGQLLAPGCTQLLGLEYDRRAVSLAQHNARSEGLSQCRYKAGDVARLLAESEIRQTPWDVILADPPRAGIAPDALQAVLELGPAYLIYISCNPATLARDAKVLQTAYRLVALSGVDLFPHTPHLECVSLWARSRTSP